MKKTLDSSLRFSNGSLMKNRFMLAPLTNQQSHENGQLSEQEFHWLTMRAEGQFGLVMTCASHVQAIGKGFSGQLGIFDDMHIEGHQRLSAGIKSYGSLAVVQLHHAGMRSPSEVIGESPVCPSENEKTGARGLSLREVEILRNDFIDAAVRAQKSGYDGVEVHGAHGYILTQFISKAINLRNDIYGGSFENRCRLLIEIIDGIRKSCGENFLLGVRLSPEKFGMDLNEIKSLSQQLAKDGKINFLDISLWDSFKLPENSKQQHLTLLDHFTSLDLKQVNLTVAGKIRNGRDAKKVLESGVDFVTIGRSAILHHDFPARVIKDPGFMPIETPVSREHLQQEGLSDMFIGYMKRWPDFVAEDD